MEYAFQHNLNTLSYFIPLLLCCEKENKNKQYKSAKEVEILIPGVLFTKGWLRSGVEDTTHMSKICDSVWFAANRAIRIY